MASNGFNTFQFLLSNKGSKGKPVMIMISVFLSLLEVPGEHQKGTTILHSKYLSQPVWPLGWMIFYMFTLQFVIDMCNHWHFVDVCFSSSSLLSYNKSRPHKNRIFGSFTTMSSEFWGFFRLSWFVKFTSHWRDTCCRVEWRGTSINDVNLQEEIKKNQTTTTCLQTPVSSKFGVAVCVALNRNELFHAGGATFMYGAVPRVSRRSTLLTPAEDIRHGVGAALDVGAVQEGPAVVADLVYSSEYQIGFSGEGKHKNHNHTHNIIHNPVTSNKITGVQKPHLGAKIFKRHSQIKWLTFMNLRKLEVNPLCCIYY